MRGEMDTGDLLLADGRVLRNLGRSPAVRGSRQWRGADGFCVIVSGSVAGGVPVVRLSISYRDRRPSDRDAALACLATMPPGIVVVEDDAPGDMPFPHWMIRFYSGIPAAATAGAAVQLN